MMLSQTVSTMPSVPSFYRDDAGLQGLVERLASPASVAWSKPVFEEMGKQAAAMEPLAALADQHPPVLHPRDRFGTRVDILEFHPAYREMMRHSYGAGLIGHYYDPAVRAKLGTDRELIKFAHGYLFSQGEQGLYCPVCMTDGSAYLIERYGSEEQKAEYLPRLAARDLDWLWEGGMWLTEKAGGSDVGANETVARRRPDGRWELNGEKWFCSNAGAEVVMVLGRPEGAPSGTRGLGLFILRRHQADGRLNGLWLERLKDKLGTRSMPTGEVLLRGAIVEGLGDLSRGFLQMAEMLNLSRLYNATASLGLMRRALREAVRYANVRHTFGRSVLSQPLVQANLGELIVEHEAALSMLLSLAAARGRLLAGQASDLDQALLRIGTPLIKYTTARLAVRLVSEALELHGGNGYMEDWPLARMHRDAQVLPIWEGTTNILVLDTLRAIQRENAHQALRPIAEGAQDSRLAASAVALEAELPRVLDGNAGARRWCDRAMQVLQAGLLSSTASTDRARTVAQIYLSRHFGEDRDSFTPEWQNHALAAFSLLVGRMVE
ncbi:MAG: acyl-CoA dehydrogenase family protein [Candidatus Xenobia bacterium]